MSKSKLKFACYARFLFYKDGAICAKNSPKRTSHGAARATVKLNSLRSPSPIMASDIELLVNARVDASFFFFYFLIFFYSNYLARVYAHGKLNFLSSFYIYPVLKSISIVTKVLRTICIHFASIMCHRSDCVCLSLLLIFSLTFLRFDKLFQYLIYKSDVWSLNVLCKFPRVGFHKRLTLIKKPTM